MYRSLLFAYLAYQTLLISFAYMQIGWIHIRVCLKKKKKSKYKT